MVVREETFATTRQHKDGAAITPVYDAVSQWSTVSSWQARDCRLIKGRAPFFLLVSTVAFSLTLVVLPYAPLGNSAVYIRAPIAATCPRSIRQTQI